MKHKILAVTKDMASSRGMIPIVKELKKKGDEIVLVSEGLSTDDWLEAGFEPIFKGSKDFKKEPFECDIDAIMEAVSPNVVFTGIGLPINLEDRFAQAANMTGVPVISYEDLWAGHTRLSGYPSVVLAIDEVAAFAIRSKARLTKTKVVCVGNASVIESVSKPVPATTVAKINELRSDGSIVVLMAGAGGYTTDMLNVTFQSVLKTAGRVRLIVRLHPKYFPQTVKGGDMTYGEYWKMLVDDFQSRNPGVVVELDGKKHKTDDLARCCDVVISTAGTVLLNAAASGRVPVSVMTPITAEGLQELMPGLEHYPLVDAGAVVEVREPVDLATLVERGKALKAAQDAYFQSWDGGLERAVAAFEQQL